MRDRKSIVFPFSCQLVGSAGTVPGLCLNLISSGMLVNTAAIPLKVNHTYQVTFILPLVDSTVSLEAVVFKTYDHFQGHGMAQAGSHLSELVFRSVSPEVRKNFRQFHVAMQHPDMKVPKD